MSERWKGLQDGFTLFSKQGKLLKKIEELRVDMKGEGKKEEVDKINKLWKKCHTIRTCGERFACHSHMDACRQNADSLFQRLEFVKQDVEAWEANDGVTDIWSVYCGLIWTTEVDNSLHFYCKGLKQGFSFFNVLDELEDQIVCLRQHAGEHLLQVEEDKLSSLQLYREKMCNLLIRK
jgi:hypothetical protein